MEGKCRAQEISGKLQFIPRPALDSPLVKVLYLYLRINYLCLKQGPKTGWTKLGICG